MAREGQGGTLDGPVDTSIQASYTIQESTIQAVNSVSTDYLNDIKPNKVTDYTVQPGDALSFIASDFGVSTDSIIWANKLSNIDNLTPGQIIRIPPVTGVIHVVQKGDTISSIAKKYNGEAAKIISFNDLTGESTLDLGDELIIPNGTPALPNTKVVASVNKNFLSSVTSAAKRFAYLADMSDYFRLPATGFDWGIVHGRNGVDVANACGTPILAAADGNIATALSSGYNGGFGKYIKIVHPNGTETLYAHLSKLLVKEGASVSKGQQIALMGTTGHSTGCHLHFEVHGARNPLAKY